MWLWQAEGLQECSHNEIPLPCSSWGPQFYPHRLKGILNFTVAPQEIAFLLSGHKNNHCPLFSTYKIAASKILWSLWLCYQISSPSFPRSPWLTIWNPHDELRNPPSKALWEQWPTHCIASTLSVVEDHQEHLLHYHQSLSILLPSWGATASRFALWESLPLELLHQKGSRSGLHHIGFKFSGASIVCFDQQPIAAK